MFVIINVDSPYSTFLICAMTSQGAASSRPLRCLTLTKLQYRCGWNHTNPHSLQTSKPTQNQAKSKVKLLYNYPEKPRKRNPLSNLQPPTPQWKQIPNSITKHQTRITSLHVEYNPRLGIPLDPPLPSLRTRSSLERKRRRSINSSNNRNPIPKTFQRIRNSRKSYPFKVVLIVGETKSECKSNISRKSIVEREKTTFETVVKCVKYRYRNGNEWGVETFVYGGFGMFSGVCCWFIGYAAEGGRTCYGGGG